MMNYGFMNDGQIIKVDCANKTLTFNGLTMKCAIGKGGTSKLKHEGDGKTPLGTFALRELFWRKDKLGELKHNFTQATIISPSLGWCDAPTSNDYNKLIKLPHAQSHEELWRNDGRYDVIIPLGYNDSPVVSGLGSAIFFHIAEHDAVSRNYEPTQGCIAISLADMLKLLPHLPSKIMMLIT